MLPKLSKDQNVYVEITNLVHGGNGWELGSCIWSPMFSKGGARSWKIIENIREGDLIIHLVDIKNQYYWKGISIASSTIIQNLQAPPMAETWRNMYPYQRVNLTNYNKINTPISINEFFIKYEDKLKEIYTKSDFYVIYGPQRELRISQRYIAKCHEKLYHIFNDYSNEIDFNPLFKESNYYPTLNEPQNPDYNSPRRIKTIISRVIRDTPLCLTYKFIDG